MNTHPIFSKPVWQNFTHIEGVYNLPPSALVAADEMFDAFRRSDIAVPTSSDYAMWAQETAADDPIGWLGRLEVASAVILPSEMKKIRASKVLLRNDKAPKDPERIHQPDATAPWDPCARVDAPRARKVSIFPWELPASWQAALRRAATGFPGKKAGAPSRDILQRTRDKLCQLAWCAREVGLIPDLTEDMVRRYLVELETRLQARPHGIRWATMRATVEELYRFARYIGTLDGDDQRYLMKRLTRYELLERGQDALKFTALLETGNTTLSVMEKADELLALAASEENPDARHRLRNAGAILGLYSIVPLRNADARLIFGKTLLWESGTWVIDTPIQKTMARSPDHLVVPLEPEFARYVDIVVLGDFDRRHLPELRARAARSGLPMIVHPDGSHMSHTFIPRIFKKQTGNSFTTTRTMLHTDQAINRGEAGTQGAMDIAHQRSPKTAKRYQEKRVRQVAINRVQDARAARHAEFVPRGRLDALRKIAIDKEEQE